MLGLSLLTLVRKLTGSGDELLMVEGQGCS